MKGRRKLSKEYKVEAIRLAEQRGALAASESLGIDISLICSWKNALESKGAEAFRGNGNRTALEEENPRPRLENLRPRQEAEILDKASAYIARNRT